MVERLRKDELRKYSDAIREKPSLRERRREKRIGSERNNYLVLPPWLPDPSS